MATSTQMTHRRRFTCPPLFADRYSLRDTLLRFCVARVFACVFFGGFDFFVCICIIGCTVCAIVWHAHVLLRCVWKPPRTRHPVYANTPVKRASRGSTESRAPTSSVYTHSGNTRPRNTPPTNHPTRLSRVVCSDFCEW